MFIGREDAQHIVDEMKTSIHRDINIMDGEGVILASTNPARQGKLHQGALRIIREGLPGLTIWEDDPEAGVQRGINLPIVLDGQLAGVIGVTGDPAEVSVFGDIIKRMTEIMVESIRQQEQSDLLDRAKSLFVENWLFSDAPDLSELEVRGRLLGLDIAAPYTVAILRLAEDDSARLRRPEDLWEVRSSMFLRMAQNRIGRNGRNFCAVMKNQIIVLLCRSGRKDAFNVISRVRADIEGYCGVRVSGGISSASRDPLDIRRCYLEARTAGAAAAQSPRHPIVFYDQVSLEFILESIPAAIRRDLCHMVFSSCQGEEREELLRTIRVYFECDGDIRACAERCCVHRNTFQYRMDRVKKRTGYSLRVPRESFLLYLAAREAD